MLNTDLQTRPLIRQEEAAAIKLQDTIRRKLPLNASTQKMQNDMLFMKKQMKKLKDDVDNYSATDIQRAFRGHKVRKQLPEIIEEYDRQQLINKVNEIEQRANKMSDAAIKIQSAARNRKALKELYKREDRRDKYKNLINSGEIQEAFNRRENRRIKATMIQSVVRNRNALNETISRAVRKNEVNDAATTIQNAI